MQPDWIRCLLPTTVWNSTAVKHYLKQVFSSTEKNGCSVFPLNLLLKVKYFFVGPTADLPGGFFRHSCWRSKSINTWRNRWSRPGRITRSHPFGWACLGKKCGKNQVPSVCSLVCTKRFNLLPMWADRERHIKPNRTKVSDCSTLVVPVQDYHSSARTSSDRANNLQGQACFISWVTSGVNKADCVMFPNICLVWAKHT